MNKKWRQVSLLVGALQQKKTIILLLLQMLHTNNKHQFALHRLIAPQSG
jgi:hypothetical protein